MGFDMPSVRRQSQAQQNRLRTMTARFDHFLVRSEYDVDTLMAAYGLRAEPMRVGYPRNDALVDPAKLEREVKALREQLGLTDRRTVVMYAPTWREAVQEEVSLLDLERLGPILGPGFTLLRRGHVRSLGNSAAARAANVLDVSTYPQINHLLGVADVLITDYSSMMFDYTVTGRPIVFYTPDIDDYTDDKVRGSYFDLEERAPGPVTREVGDVVRLLRSLDAWPAEYAERYRAWEERYNVLDDGHASRRAVQALLDFRPDGRPRSWGDVDQEAVFDSDTEGPESESSELDSDVETESSSPG